MPFSGKAISYITQGFVSGEHLSGSWKSPKDPEEVCSPWILRLTLIKERWIQRRKNRRDYMLSIFDGYDEAIFAHITIFINMNIHKDTRVLFDAKGAVMEEITKLLLIK